jgi:hypothetical protein
MDPEKESIYLIKKNGQFTGQESNKGELHYGIPWPLM